MIVTITVTCQTLTYLYNHLAQQESDVPCSHHFDRRRLQLIRSWLENTLLDHSVMDMSDLDTVTQECFERLCEDLESRLNALFPHGDWLAIVPVNPPGTIVVLMALEG